MNGFKSSLVFSLLLNKFFSMNKFSRIIWIISTICCFLCLVGSIWMASVMRDSMSYIMVVFFFIALLYFGMNVVKNNKNK